MQNLTETEESGYLEQHSLGRGTANFLIRANQYLFSSFLIVDFKLVLTYLLLTPISI